MKKWEEDHIQWSKKWNRAFRATIAIGVIVVTVYLTAIIYIIIHALQQR